MKDKKKIFFSHFKALDKAGIPAVVFGKAIYEGKINLKELIQEQNK